MKISNNIKNNIEVSICIVTWNACAVLRECLNSIYNTSKNISLEVIVVDNASSDDTTKMIENEYPQATLIQNEVNRGFAKANNQAIEICHGKYILILNPDVLINKSFLIELISFIQNHSGVGVVGCKLVNINGNIEKSYYYEFPTPLSEFKWGFLLHRLFKKPNVSDYPNKDVIEVAWIIGACMFFKAETLRDLGGFSEKYNIYTEDADLCFRLKSHDLKVYYLKSVEIIHYHGASSAKQKKHYFATVMQRESRYIFMHDHYGTMSALLYRLSWISSGIMRVFILFLLYITGCIRSKQIREKYIKTLETYLRVVFWGIGFERWTRNPLS